MRSRAPARFGTRVPLALSAVLIGLAGACAEPGSGAGDLEVDGAARAPETAASPTRHEVTADDGHGLIVWEKRPAAAPRGSVLLLHGRTWSSLPDFDLQVEGESLSLMDGLVSAGFAVYALDARGYGATPRDEDGWLEPDRMSDDVVGVLRWIADRDGARPALFGWSFGSTVAHLAAQREPDLVAGVSLFGYWKDPARPLDPEEQPAEPPRAPTTAEAAASDFIVPGSISEGAIAAYVDAALAADPVRVDIAQREQFNELDPGALVVPVQILQGEHDPIAPTEVQARLFAGLGTGDREWVVLGGCDHAAFLEVCRGRFLRALTGFLAEITGEPRTGPGAERVGDEPTADEPR